MAQKTTTRLFELDSLRGIAAILVVLFHFTMNRHPRNWFSSLGLTGVELFFIISGFVILMTLEKTASAKQFIFSRITRLYPTYWFCVTFTSFIIIAFKFANLDLHFLIKYVANMTMFQPFLLQANIDGPYWTMVIEMTFYILMLILYSTGNLKRVEMIGGLLLLPLILYGTYLSYKVSWLDQNIYRFLGLVNFFPLFLSGIVFYKLKFEGGSWVRYGLLFLCYFVQLTLFHTVHTRTHFISIYQYAPTLAVYYLIFLLYTQNKLGFIVSRGTVFFGNISYPLYLIHQFISLSLILPYLLHYMPFWFAAAINFSIVSLIAYLINRFIEKPAMSYVRQKWFQEPVSKKEALTS